jgi:hypothetical protein
MSKFRVKDELCKKNILVGQRLTGRQILLNKPSNITLQKYRQMRPLHFTVIHTGHGDIWRGLRKHKLEGR